MDHRFKRTASAPIYRLHPLISLEICHICAGRGYVFAWRQRVAHREACVNCAERGSVVTDGSTAPEAA